jgi:hypothetical protein
MIFQCFCGLLLRKYEYQSQTVLTEESVSGTAKFKYGERRELMVTFRC